MEILNKEQFLTKRDLVVGSLIAVVMATVFVQIGSTALEATFLPSLFAGWAIFAWMYFRKKALPGGAVFIPLYLVGIAWQFIHFNEEFSTGFARMFPILYGLPPFSNDRFVSINMISYFLFTVSALLVFVKQLRFLMVPVLFFIMAGALGNAVWHSWWVIWLQGYFPGFVSALVYWVIGFILLNSLIKDRKMTFGIIVLLIAILVPSLTLLASPDGIMSIRHSMGS